MAEYHVGCGAFGIYAWSGAQYCQRCGAPMRERKEE